MFADRIRYVRYKTALATSGVALATSVDLSSITDLLVELLPVIVTVSVIGGIIGLLNDKLRF